MLLPAAKQFRAREPNINGARYKEREREQVGRQFITSESALAIRTVRRKPRQMIANGQSFKIVWLNKQASKLQRYIDDHIHEENLYGAIRVSVRVPCSCSWSSYTRAALSTYLAGRVAIESRL